MKPPAADNGAPDRLLSAKPAIPAPDGRPCRIATATYPLDWFDSWDAYRAKITQWVETASENHADLLVFPEYGAMELAGLAGAKAKNDLEFATRHVAQMSVQANALLSDLAFRFQVYILGPSGPVQNSGTWINRAHFFSPQGQVAYQDKQIMTPWEADPWGIVGKPPLSLFDTAFGRIGVLVCYDCEFPLLARALCQAGADILLIPSCTDTIAGYWRVRIGAMARALEGQCFTVMASLCGDFPVSAVDRSHGAGGVFAPPDVGMPSDGIIALGALDRPGWTYGDVDPGALSHLRQNGGVRTRADWPASRTPNVTAQRLW